MNQEAGDKEVQKQLGRPEAAKVGFEAPFRSSPLGPLSPRCFCNLQINKSFTASQF